MLQYIFDILGKTNQFIRSTSHRPLNSKCFTCPWINSHRPLNSKKNSHRLFVYFLSQIDRLFLCCRLFDTLIAIEHVLQDWLFSILTARISTPLSSYGLDRNPRYANAGKFMRLSDFLDFSKDKDLSGVMISIEVSISVHTIACFYYLLFSFYDNIVWF
jgi:hypothetical protein